MRLTLKRAFRLGIYYLLKRLLKLEFRESYSQIAEDLIISQLLQQKKIKTGTYVDVGCNHPVNYSNTFKLYLEGWSGVTIDLNNNLIDLHKYERKFDIQYNAPISNKNEYVDVHYFKSNLISSINKNFIGKVKAVHQIESIEKNVKSITLDELLEEVNVYSVDLLFIDVEGHDFNVLKSINLIKYQPSIIIIELHDLILTEASQHPVVKYLSELNYSLNSFCVVNAFFTKNK